MDLIRTAVDFFLHLDKHLAEIIARYGVWTNLILFLVVFCETGLVVTPFLPGDSLLFAAGTFAALGSLDPGLLVLLLSVAAILGDTVNYWMARTSAPAPSPARSGGSRRSISTARTRSTRSTAGKTIILARFVPIIRTFAPFVAGVGAMTYSRFLLYNVVGGIVWVTLFVLAGYFFGNLPVVRQNFTYVILAIIALSVMPIVVEFLKARRRARGVTRRYLVSGRVQGVGFRWFVLRHAQREGSPATRATCPMAGWKSWRVGTPRAMRGSPRRSGAGPPDARVDDVTISDDAAAPAASRFEIR